MTESTTATKPKRPEFRNINAFKDLTTYRMTPSAWVSILHRASGAIMFLLMPFIIWMFDSSLSSEISFAKFSNIFSNGAGFVPGWFFKLIALALIWAYLHHLFAGVRHLRMDLNHDKTTKEYGKSTALIVLVLSIGLTFVLALKLFDVY